MGIGGVVDSRLAEIANVLLVFLDLLVAAREIQRHLRHIVHAGVADVPYRDAGVGIPLLDLQEALGGAQVGRRSHTDILRADLLQVEQIIVGGLGVSLRAELDSGLRGVHGGGRFAGGRQQGGGAQGATQRQFSEFATVVVGHCHILPEQV